MEEGEGCESRHLTICFSNSHRNPQRNSHYICDSNFFANIISITIPIFDSISDSNAITESDNSSGWILRREVE